MLLASVQPYGARLRRPSRLKIKGLNVVPKASDIATATDQTGWGKMWANFDWSGWLKPQIDLAKNNGANCIKVTGSRATSDYPSAATFTSRVRQFLDYCWANNLYVYWNFTSSDWGGGNATATAPYLQAVCAILAAYPHIIGLDVANEIGTGSFMTVAEAQALIPYAQAACNLPCTASVHCSNAGDLTGATAAAIAPYVDFMDFHPYYGDSADPATTDWATFRGESWYKPWLIGECGQRLSAGPVAQTSRWASLGSISAAADCFGVVGFCVADYDTVSGNEWGMYAADLFTVRTTISTPFASWPSAS